MTEHHNAKATNGSQAENDFLACVKAELNQSEHELSGEILSKLRQARQHAVEQSERSSPSWFSFLSVNRHPWLASGASVLAIALVFSYVQLTPNT